MMKIAVTATGAGTDARIDQRFGRCPWFAVVDTDTMEFEAIENPNVALGGGAGIQSAQLLADRGVAVVLTGNCGPNAFRTFEAAGVEVVVGVDGPVRDAVERFRSGGFSAGAAPNVPSHSGTTAFARGGGGGGGGGGRGGGMGRGGGGGRGMGTGRGQGRGRSGGAMAAAVPAGPATSTSDIEALKEQARDLESRLRDVRESIAGHGEPRGAASARRAAVIDADRCTGCGLCAEICPMDAISIDGIAVVDETKCGGCARCVAECPRGAVFLKTV